MLISKNAAQNDEIIIEITVETLNPTDSNENRESSEAHESTNVWYDSMVSLM